jgi:inosine-uridine nucleoside N-ribohydrolase
MKVDFPRFRFPFASISSLLLAFLLGSAGLAAEAPISATRAKIPVILDTDIGDDIDDTWALGLLLKSPELDLKLAVGDHGKSLYRAKILAKFLEKAGKSGVPVGLGADLNARGSGPQEAWVKDYNLNQYPGRVYPDGVQAIIDTIMASPEPVVLIAIGPVPNLKEALRREPRIAQKTRVTGMQGSVRLGYNGDSQTAPEYNVKEDARACQAVFTAPWPITITPLDTCGLIDLEGGTYQKVVQSKDPIAAAIIENYQLWSAAQAKPGQTIVPPAKSTILFDTVAVFLAFSENWLTLEELPIRVTDDGYTRIEAGAKVMRVATQWKDRDAYRQFLVDRLAGQ